MQGNNQTLQDYVNQYTEKSLLGRGNYGSAYLVEAKDEPRKYVAKKIMLDGLNAKEVEAAWGEVEILKKLGRKQNKPHCPFIVEYIKSFHFDNTLIIVMEYCEHGDLTTFLKNWKKRGELLSEVVIVNWFIQMVFGIAFLHSKGVLHRDLKAANIFLTSNRTIKIGDFGISKILDTTSTKTFVGTPYYLSPQVCENRPYDFRSDLWALGCILYEMCTLEYPFQASNVLSLAMKILNEKVKPISDTYSPQLNEIVIRLLTKNEKERIKLDEIKMMPYINMHISNYEKERELVNQIILKGKTNNASIKDISAAEETEDSSSNQTLAEDTMKTIQSNFALTNKSDTLAFTKSTQSKHLEKTVEQPQLTPMQRLKLKKQQQADREIQRLKQQAKKNSENKNFSKMRKQQNLGQSAGFTQTMKNDISKKIQYENQKVAESKKIKKNQMEKNQTINLETLNNILQKNKNSNFSETDFEDIPLPSQKQYVLIPRHQSQDIQEVEQEIQEYYDQEFEEYNDDENRPMTTQQENQLEVIQGIMAIAVDKTVPLKKNESPVSKNITLRSPDPKLQSVIKGYKNQALVKKSIQAFGQKRFVQIYGSMKNGSFDFKDLKKKYTKDQQQLLRGIQEMAYQP